ncbi:MAG: DEAD/DEAH box helicase family protein [Methylocystis sp.]|uniref:DEAD/DEAH box helicase family protein n=1 Tax=Methylocystis sp. TaxID=1911079 RepID=UPI003DA29038
MFDFVASQKTIKFVSAPCGAGKTYATCEFIADNLSEANYLYVAPSLVLLEQTRQTLESFGVRPTVITSETHPNHVKETIMGFLKKSPHPGETLLITWSSYIELPYFNRRENWEIFIDEIPQLDRFYDPALPRNLRFITDHIDLNERTSNDKVAAVSVKDPKALRKLLDGVIDDAEEKFRRFYGDLLSPNTKLFVDLNSWNRVVEERQVSEREDSNRIFFLSMLNFEPFRGATLLGANVPDSLVYRWLTAYHERLFVEHKDIASRLRILPRDSRLKISYFIPGRFASKHLYEQRSPSGKRIIDEMDRLAAETFGSEPFLFVANNGRKSALDGNPLVTKIPVVSHGLNSYDDFSRIYFSPALNRQSEHFRMMTAVGLHSTHVHMATAHEVLYQSVLRTSLRNPESKEQVHAIVPDEMSAGRLAELAGAFEVRQIGPVMAPPLMPLTPTQKDQRHKARKTIHAIFKSGNRTESMSGNVPKNQPSLLYKDQGRNLGHFLDSDNTASPSRAGNAPSCFVTLHKEKDAFERDDFFPWYGTIEEFLQFLREQHKAVIEEKSESVFFNPCLFDPPEGAEGYRRKDYFVASSMMVLDFDGGDLSPEKFEEIFWSKARRGQKRSFAICNSFSRSEKLPNKFRVFMFYRRPVTSFEQHLAIYNAIVSRLEENGYTAASAKLDKACKAGNQSFYLPCTNRRSQEWAFFRTHGTKTDELNRCSFDPELFGKTVKPVAPRAPKRAVAVPNVTPEQIHAVTEKLSMMAEDRHGEVFDAGLKLALLGLSQVEIEAALYATVGSEPHMKKKVPDVIKSLKKYGRL